MQGIGCAIDRETAAMLVGVLALAGQLGWPLLRSRRAIIGLQMAVALGYAAQYGLLGAWVGTGVACLGASQSALALVAGERAWLRRAGYGFLPLLGAVCVVTWCGPESLMAMCACGLVMLARLQTCTLRLRMMMLAASPFGIAFDATVGSLPALAGAVTSMAIAAAMLRREWVSRQGAVAL